MVSYIALYTHCTYDVDNDYNYTTCYLKFTKLNDY